METGPTTPHWRTEEYAAALHAWVEAQVGPVRMKRVKLRAWSTVWRAGAGDGVFWAKQNCPSQAFEGELTRLLSRLTPERVLEPVAVRDDGAFLLPDGGAVLRDVESPERSGHPAEYVDLDSWKRVVGEWAELQRALSGHADQLTAVGVPTLRPGAVASWALTRADELHDLDTADPRHLGDREWTLVRAADQVLREAAAALEDLGLPVTLNHNDLHDGNSFVGGYRPLRFFDLADAVLTEPMAVLLVPLGQLPDDSRVRAEVARAWVEVWREVTDEAALWRALPHALRLAAFARHEAWWRVMGSMTEEELVEWGRAAPYWLGRVAEPPPELVMLAGAE